MAIQFATPENFDELTKEGFVIADFFSATCVPCKMLSQILEDIEAELPFVNIVKANTTDYPEFSDRFQIRAVPTIFFYQNGQQKEKHIGMMSAEELKEIIKKYLY